MPSLKSSKRDRSPSTASGACAERSRPALAGSALMEYAVPAAIILLAAGVLMTISDTTGLMASFFLSASGRSTSSLSGTTLKTNGLGENSFGNVDNGLSGVTFFGSQAPVAGTGGTSLFIGAVTRTGPPAAPSDPEYLFP